METSMMKQRKGKDEAPKDLCINNTQYSDT